MLRKAETENPDLVPGVTGQFIALLLRIAEELQTRS